ncbi:o-succinylbenzoate synthase [Elizabethkingia argentiflava]|uniref:O-succinylbenzoate synthase n=1 Tax=Elizabethkingia argenteiflava TaxID=2681556 RepID=A0A845PSH2_9FLAO|nr:o-succinylbenzoate synthase [Elizabethkingia argenteiflava]NAW51209.1 o-succinylbenzoate synthase [Elizabethkingia argenteiflava]
MQAEFHPYQLIFKRPGGTSRGVLTHKDTFFLQIEKNKKKGIGECGIFRGLSYDDVPLYEEKLEWLCQNIDADYEFLRQELVGYPSIWIGYEQAMLNLKYGGNLYFPSDFTKAKESIPTNGLIWMGELNFMKAQIEKKLKENFKCLKLKIGINWKVEKKVLEELRSIFPASELELRVDANGAFTTAEAISVLKELARLEIHSIEQPIKAGTWQDMAYLCAHTPTPIALDEELIGVFGPEKKEQLLKSLRPQYIILKPSLVGGFSGSDEWIDLAERYHIGWWITSALESNIGLNAIAQYTYTKKNPMHQGLGTGALFTNNTLAQLELKGEHLWMKMSCAEIKI